MCAPCFLPILLVFHSPFATLSLADTWLAACGSLKWKPPSENSIDFKLVLRFAPTPGKPKVPDFQTKPIFELHVWCGDDRGVPRYEFYDVMYVADDEWERSVGFFFPSRRLSHR